MEALKRIRLHKGWSQQDLAKRSGVGQDTISALELGKHEARPSTMRKLAAALDVQVADFFKEEASGPKVMFRAPLDLEWALSAPEDEFMGKIGEAPLEELVEIERGLIARFREIKAQHSANGPEQWFSTSSGKPRSMPNEFLVVWGRANDVQREIIAKRKYPEEAPITPELNREFEKLVRQGIEIQT